MNSRKNKLNSEIIYNFNLHPNAHLINSNNMMSTIIKFISTYYMKWLQIWIFNKKKNRDKTYFRPYIFTRFSLWSLTFFFTTFSPYPGKRVSFLSLPLHQRRNLHSWQTEKIKNIKIMPTVSTWLSTSTSKLKKLIY